MNDIEQIKIDLTLKTLSATLDANIDIRDMPINDDLRTFICSISPRCAFYYAKLSDEKPHNETRIAACKDPQYAYLYAVYVDKCLHNETREAASKHCHWFDLYLQDVEKILPPGFWHKD